MIRHQRVVMTHTIHTFIAAIGLLALIACNSSDEKKARQDAKEKARLHVQPNQRITSDTLDVSFYLPGMFTFSQVDTHRINNAQYVVYEFLHAADSGLRMQITIIDDSGKYGNTANLSHELDHLFAAYPDKKNNYGYMDTINKFPFVHVREKAGLKSKDADMVFSWVMNKYFSLKITNTSFIKCDTACYQRMKDSVLGSIVFQRTAIEAPVQAPPTAADPSSEPSQQ
jgi:hypothetical protein